MSKHGGMTLEAQHFELLSVVHEKIEYESIYSNYPYTFTNSIIYEFTALCRYRFPNARKRRPYEKQIPRDREKYWKSIV